MTTMTTGSTVLPDAERQDQPALDAPGSARALPPPRPALVELRDMLARWGFGRLELGLFLVLGAVALPGVAVTVLLTLLRHPEAADWGTRLMNLDRGLIQTGCLLLGGACLIWAAWAARHGAAALLRVALGAALLGAAGFLTVLAIDYDAKIWHGLGIGRGFEPSERYVARHFGVRLPRRRAPQTAVAAAPLPPPPPARLIDATNGRRLFVGTCAGCHGPAGEGMPGQGKPLTTSEFVTGHDDDGLLAFIVKGRQPWEPDNTTNVAMPPRGGNPTLSDADLQDIVAYLRELQAAQPQVAAAPADTAAAAPDSAQADDEAALAAADADADEDAAAPVAAAAAPAAPELFVQRWVVPRPPAGPEGVSPQFVAAMTRPPWQPPEGASAYFAAFFGATGSIGVHVLVAAVAILVLLLRPRRAAPPFAPVLLVSTVWWWTTACWLVVFPMFWLW